MPWLRAQLHDRGWCGHDAGDHGSLPRLRRPVHPARRLGVPPGTVPPTSPSPTIVVAAGRVAEKGPSGPVSPLSPISPFHSEPAIRLDRAPDGKGGYGPLPRGRAIALCDRERSSVGGPWSPRRIEGCRAARLRAATVVTVPRISGDGLGSPRFFARPGRLAIAFGLLAHVVQPDLESRSPNPRRTLASTARTSTSTRDR